MNGLSKEQTCLLQRFGPCFANSEKQKIVAEAESLEKRHDEILNEKLKLQSQYTSGDSYDEAERRKELNNPILTNPKLLENI